MELKLTNKTLKILGTFHSSLSSSNYTHPLLDRRRSIRAIAEGGDGCCAGIEVMIASTDNGVDVDDGQRRG